MLRGCVCACACALSVVLFLSYTIAWMELELLGIKDTIYKSFLCCTHAHVKSLHVRLNVIRPLALSHVAQSVKRADDRSEVYTKPTTAPTLAFTQHQLTAD